MTRPMLSTIALAIVMMSTLSAARFRSYNIVDNSTILTNESASIIGNRSAVAALRERVRTAKAPKAPIPAPSPAPSSQFADEILFENDCPPPGDDHSERPFQTCVQCPKTPQLHPIHSTITEPGVDHLRRVNFAIENIATVPVEIVWMLGGEHSVSLGIVQPGGVFTHFGLEGTVYRFYSTVSHQLLGEFQPGLRKLHNHLGADISSDIISEQAGGDGGDEDKQALVREIGKAHIGMHVDVGFHNTLKTKLELFYSSDMEETMIAKVKPGASYYENVWPGHEFIARTPSGKAVAALRMDRVYVTDCPEQGASGLRGRVLAALKWARGASK